MKSQTAINWTMALAVAVVMCPSTAEPTDKPQNTSAEAEIGVGVRPDAMLALCQAALGKSTTMFTREHGGLACETQEMRATAVAAAQR